MQRRTFLQGLAAAGLLGSVPFSLAHAVSAAGSVSVETLPKLEGDLTLYLGRGEGGLYEKQHAEHLLETHDDRHGIRPS